MTKPDVRNSVKSDQSGSQGKWSSLGCVLLNFGEFRISSLVKCSQVFLKNTVLKLFGRKEGVQEEGVGNNSEFTQFPIARQSRRELLEYHDSKRYAFNSVPSPSSHCKFIRILHCRPIGLDPPPASAWKFHN